MKEVKVQRPEEYFVSDITYIKSRERTHYLSLVTDAYSRKIMSYQRSDDMSFWKRCKSSSNSYK